MNKKLQMLIEIMISIFMICLCLQAIVQVVLKTIDIRRFRGIPGKITSSPAKHLSTLCNQMVNFLGIMQNEWAGAQAFSSFDTYLAPFSNITLDWTVLNDLAKQHVIVGGKELEFCYEDCQHEMDIIHSVFINIMIKGDAEGRGFQYPIPTYSITKDFNWSETENNKLLFTVTSKYGTPYFSNYINSGMDPSDIKSMCCCFRLDLREFRKKAGGFFGSSENTGSIGVVTINLP